MQLDMYMTAVAGIAALGLGSWMNRNVPGLKRMCIPAPVTGGIVASLVTLALYQIWGIEVHFDGTLKDICMMVFFTTIGLQSNLTVIRTGGRPLVLMVCLVALLIALQNITGIGLASGLGVNKLIGLAAGSITMCGGHGTAAGFSGMLSGMGLQGADSVAIAAATFGLLAGSLMGGPLADSIIRRKKLCETGDDSKAVQEQEGIEIGLSGAGYTRATFLILVSMGIGSLLNILLAKTGITFPTYFSSMIVGAVICNVTELSSRLPRPDNLEIGSISTISLSLFLGMAMVSLRLWELSGIALPLLGILCAQTLLMALYARFVAFPVLGRNYDAALLVSGLCGFGLGATPNAMANMSAVASRHRYSTMPFMVVPIVGAVFVDIINIGLITLFANLI